MKATERTESSILLEIKCAILSNKATNDELKDLLYDCAAVIFKYRQQTQSRFIPPPPMIRDKSEQLEFDV